ncbi:FAD/NAD(P)-binding oxidoreductase family protein [Abeliophyllum distichum]|uniref:FAD/NAD(P)-binding oxidoreductase family protein n=1 Tax=Abeliophyllum distichum TaxID=126358 RepID=A0ABD1RUZ5_9LAMI
MNSLNCDETMVIYYCSTRAYLQIKDCTGCIDATIMGEMVEGFLKSTAMTLVNLTRSMANNDHCVQGKKELRAKRFRELVQPCTELQAEKKSYIRKSRRLAQLLQAEECGEHDSLNIEICALEDNNERAINQLLMENYLIQLLDVVIKFFRMFKLGIKSLVLESSDHLRITGFALIMCTNACRILDALGIGDYLKTKSVQIHGGNSESKCVKRKDMLETLEKELPNGTIRYSSKVVSIEESGNFKLVHLAYGSVVKTKVFIQCDGVNSIVAKWLGLQNLDGGGLTAIRGYPNDHGFEVKFHAYFGGRFRCGSIS